MTKVFRTCRSLMIVMSMTNEIEEDDYVISPERTYSHSDTEDQAIKKDHITISSP